MRSGFVGIAEQPYEQLIDAQFCSTQTRATGGECFAACVQIDFQIGRNVAIAGAGLDRYVIAAKKAAPRVRRELLRVYRQVDVFRGADRGQRNAEVAFAAVYRGINTFSRPRFLPSPAVPFANRVFQIVAAHFESDKAISLKRQKYGRAFLCFSEGNNGRSNLGMRTDRNENSTLDRNRRSIIDGQIGVISRESDGSAIGSWDCLFSQSGRLGYPVY